ncbi:MAG TPA: Rieske 2Fe-2S domain-containing protein [Acidothermaceae bacterium]
MSAGRPDGTPSAKSNTPTARWQWLMPAGSVPTLADWALLPLRAFLGVTFCFAGLQKLANPAFFDATNPASIQAQMAGAVRRSPIHDLISPLAHHAALIGAVIALGEVAVGVGALLGLLTRIAAIGGLLLSLNLFLAVSFHTSPYYTGSDIVFVFAWMPFIIAGSGLLSLDALIANVVAARQSWSGAPIDVDRRRVLGAVAFAAAAVAALGTGAVAGLGRLFNTASPTASSDELSNGLDSPAVSSPAASSAPPATSSSPGPDGGSPAVSASSTPSGSSSSTGEPTSTPSATLSPTPTRATRTPATADPKPKPPGSKIGPATGVPVAGSAAFQDPATGDPAIVVQPKAGSFVGFDAVCPHAGCTVGYDQGRVRFVCPCHGSEFNASTGAVEVGPATRGLRRIAVAEGSDGQLYAR